MKSTFIALMALCLCLPLGCGKEEGEWPEYKTCERCKEEDVKYWADVCKHCGKDPDGPNGAEKRAELTKIWIEGKGSRVTEKESESVPSYATVTEAAIREKVGTPVGELTQDDLDRIYALDVENCKITDEDFKWLAKLKNLTNLRLSYTDITDEDVEELAKLQRLETLWVLGADLSPEAISELREALPKCRMYYSPPPFIEKHPFILFIAACCGGALCYFYRGRISDLYTRICDVLDYIYDYIYSPTVEEGSEDDGDEEDEKRRHERQIRRMKLDREKFEQDEVAALDLLEQHGYVWEVAYTDTADFKGWEVSKNENSVVYLNTKAELQEWVSKNIPPNDL